jgi:hypothetical protein
MSSSGRARAGEWMDAGAGDRPSGRDSPRTPASSPLGHLPTRASASGRPMEDGYHALGEERPHEAGQVEG